MSDSRSPRTASLAVEFIDPVKAEPEPDFASEHQSLSFADEMPGGPEHSRDPDSPKGLAGADEKFGSILNG